MTLPVADWIAALDRMTAGVNRTLVELDRHQTGWAAVTDTPATATTPDLLVAWLERRLAQWDARLSAATELAASVEKQLNDGEAAVGRWNEVFVRWREFVERGVADPGAGTAAAPTAAATSAG